MEQRHPEKRNDRNTDLTTDQNLTDRPERQVNEKSERPSGERNSGGRNSGERNGGNRNGGDRQQRERDRGRHDPVDRLAGEVAKDGRMNTSERPERNDRQSAEAAMNNWERSERNAGDKGAVDAGQAPPERLVIGISLGDYNGIGPEVILKALQHNRMQRICTPVIYGSMRILNRYRNILNLKDWNLNGIQNIGQASHKLTNVLTCWNDQNHEIQPGKVTAEAGHAAFACLQRAVEDLKAGKIDALVTAPINKHNIQSEEFAFPGHTEFLAHAFGVEDNLMFMVSETLRVGVVTGHIPLGRVRSSVTRERIMQKLSLMYQSLKQDFGIQKPKIALLGLNPHAGEEGLLGQEENEVIKPLMEEVREQGQLIYGPYPADGFFGTRSYRKFDAVLAMYHDQGLIPFKAIAFEEGVNFTAGLPIVRTSPDHGTAYDIAGKNLADETSMVQAIYLACDVARRRKEYHDLEANALKEKQHIEK